MAAATAHSSGMLEPAVECMPRAELNAYHDDKLAELSRLAYGRAPLLTRLWDEAGVRPADIRGRADFSARVPFLTKDMIRDYRSAYGAPFGGLECRELTALDGVFTSSGTTGDATFFAEEWPDGWSPHWLGATRALYGAGIRPGDYMLVGSTGMRGPHAQLAQLLGAIPIFVGLTDPQLLEVIERYRPAFMSLVGFTALELLELSKSVDIKQTFSCFKVIGFAGEPLGMAMRERFAAWGIELLTWSTAGDVSLCFECLEHDGMHMWEDTGFFEVLDVETGQPVEDGGVGELISTSLCNTIAPLARYRTEDLVRVTREPCACGRTHLRQWPVGRLGDLMVVRGVSVTPSEVWRALETVPETSAGVFQIVKTGTRMERLTIRVGYDADQAADLADLRARVGAAIWAQLAIEADLELMTTGQLLARSTTGKIQRVVKA